MKRYILSKKEIEDYDGTKKTHFLNPKAQRINKSLGDLTGLTGLGFHVIEIEPGFESTEYHVHYYEDECVYILEGEATIAIGNEKHKVYPGDFIGYRAGGKAHTMYNDGEHLLRCIVVGQRLSHDVVDYPNLNKRLYRNKSMGWDLVEKEKVSHLHYAPFQQPHIPDDDASRTQSFPSDKAKNREYYLNLRKKYHPKKVELVFLLESPPISGKYFYDENGKASEPLFAELMKLLGIQPRNKREGLEIFQKKGFLLVDATYTPVNDLQGKGRDDAILRNFDHLTDDLRQVCTDVKIPIILVKANICRLLEHRLKSKGFKIINDGIIIPFPSTGQQKRFHKEMNKVFNVSANRD